MHQCIKNDLLFSAAQGGFSPTFHDMLDDSNFPVFSHRGRTGAILALCSAASFRVR